MTDNDFVFVAIDELGDCLMDAGKLTEAEHWLRQSLDILKTFCADNQANIARSEHYFSNCICNMACII
jgi:hypothetical protein